MTGSGGSLVIMNVKKFQVTNASSWSTEQEAEMQIQRDIMPWAGCLVPGDTNIVNIDIEKKQKHFVFDAHLHDDMRTNETAESAMRIRTLLFYNYFKHFLSFLFDILDSRSS